MLVAALAVCACGARMPDAAREAYLVRTLVEADRDLANLRGERVAAKYRRMAGTLQDFLRGTAPVFYRDRTRLDGSEHSPHGDDADLVPLYGDLHVENLGATFDADGVLVDGVDYDAVIEGPFGWDLDRSALG